LTTNYQFIHPEGVTWRKSSGTEQILTDHNRGPIGVTEEPIERKQRMVNGTLRKYIVAIKRSYTLQWEMLPSKDAAVVGKSTLPILGGESIKAFVDSTRTSNSCADAAFYMRIYSGQHPRAEAGGTKPNEIRVMVSDFSYEITKRGAQTVVDGVTVDYDMWSVDVTLEEV
jgi:hypothetical protein